MPWSTESDGLRGDEVRLELGQAIRGLRRYHGLTQHQLEALSGLDQTIISRLENGHDVHVRLSRLLGLLRALEVVRITLSSRREGATIQAFMARNGSVGDSDVMRPPRDDPRASRLASPLAYVADGHKEAQACSSAELRLTADR